MGLRRLCGEQRWLSSDFFRESLLPSTATSAAAFFLGGGAIWPMNMHSHRSRHAHKDIVYMRHHGSIFSLLFVRLKRHDATVAVRYAFEMGRYEGTRGTMAAVTLCEGAALAL